MKLPIFKITFSYLKAQLTSRSIPFDKRFPKKRVIITGGGSGLGRALALALARMSWNVCVVDIVAERGRETVRLVDEAGGTGFDICADVSDSGQWDLIAREIEEKWGGIDILINNAGVCAGGPLEQFALDKWDWILKNNFMSVVYGCRRFIPVLEREGGYIVNIASNAGIASLPLMTAYNSTKAANIALSETLRSELAEKNIGVSVAAPTFFKSNLMESFYSPDEESKRLADKFFENSLVTAEDVACDILSAIDKNRFYVITQLDGRFAWFFKRNNPERYLKVTTHLYREGFIDEIYD